VTDHSSMRR